MWQQPDCVRQYMDSDDRLIFARRAGQHHRIFGVPEIQEIEPLG